LFVILTPFKNLILGIGCKKDTKAEDILTAIENCLDKNNLDIKNIKSKRGILAYFAKTKKYKNGTFCLCIDRSTKS